MITKIIANEELAMVNQVGKTLENAPMELTGKIAKQLLWTKEGWVMKTPKYLFQGCGDADCILFNYNAKSMDIIEDVKEAGVYNKNSQSR